MFRSFEIIAGQIYHFLPLTSIFYHIVEKSKRFPQYFIVKKKSTDLKDCRFKLDTLATKPFVFGALSKNKSCIVTTFILLDGEMGKKWIVGK